MAQVNMIKYIIKRVLMIIPTLFGVIIMTFVLTRLLSGSPVDIMFPPGLLYDETQRQQKIEEMGLNQHWTIQLAIYLGKFMTGDWGVSYLVAPGIPVLEWIGRMIPRTLTITLIPVVLVPIIGIKLGVTSAANRNKAIDSFSRLLSVAGTALPVFFTAMIVKLISGRFLQDFTNSQFWFPTIGYNNPSLISVYGDRNYLSEGGVKPVTGFIIMDLIMANSPILLIDTLSHLVLPILTMTISSLSGYTRITRASMLDVLQKDYVRTARAKGCPESVVLNKHALRNALIPVSTGIVLSFATAITNSMIIEITFNMQGMGQTYFQAILYRDYWMVNACAAIIGLAVMIGFLAADVIYTLIDPRIVY